MANGWAISGAKVASLILIFIFSSSGSANNALACSNTAFCSSSETPWLVIWKKPFSRHAARTWSTRCCFLAVSVPLNAAIMI